MFPHQRGWASVKGLHFGICVSTKLLQNNFGCFSTQTRTLTHTYMSDNFQLNSFAMRLLTMYYDIVGTLNLKRYQIENKFYV